MERLWALLAGFFGVAFGLALVVCWTADLPDGWLNVFATGGVLLMIYNTIHAEFHSGSRLSLLYAITEIATVISSTIFFSIIL